MSQFLEINDLSLLADGRMVIEHISFELENGSTGCLIGPSGAGKSSLLHCIAGFHQPHSGTIHIDGVLVGAPNKQLPPEQREVGMVFQNYALFPHLSVAENIAFGIRKLPVSDKTKRVDEMLELAGLGEHRNHYPHQLSGGEQQRVALVRAIAPKPRLLLLDEPFSSLDEALRMQLAYEIKSMLAEQKITALLVTHSQNEAFTVSDMLGVIDAGRLLQWDKTYNVYHKPTSRKVATFIGMGSMLQGRVTADGCVETALGRLRCDKATEYTEGREIEVLIRPDDIIHDDTSSMQAVVAQKQFRGAEFLYQLELKNGENVYCFAPSHHDHKIGEPIGIVTDIEHVIVFDTPA